MALKLVKRYRLEHPTKQRYYTFRPDGGRVEVERWDGFRLDWRVWMPRAQARGRWRWLVKLGYREW